MSVNQFFALTTLQNHKATRKFSLLFLYFTVPDKLRNALKKSLLVLLLVLSYLSLTGSDQAVSEYDTLRLIRGSRVILPDGSKLKYDRDTTVVIHNSIRYKIRYPRGEAGDIFFDSLETKASRKRWTRQLHNIVITSPNRPDLTDTVRTQVSADPFISHGGKYIRSIRYQKLEPFGPSINNPGRPAESRLEVLGNDVHRVTQDRVLDNHRLFAAGDLVNPNKLADNERILRQLPFIQDARIIISDPAAGSDSVDILILVKDNFSIGIGGELRDIDVGRLSLFDKNIFGMGHEFHLDFHWDGERSPWTGNEIWYKIHNISGSFINSKILYSRIFDAETYQFEMQRKFFTPDIKWAGAMNLERSSELRMIDYIDTADQVMQVKYNSFDLWAGRSFKLASNRRQSLNRLNIVLASRLLRNHYIDRPEGVSENLFYDYHTRNIWLTSFSLTSQSFFKSNLILDFGRTEDVPQGFLLSLSAGPEINEFNTRFYAGLSFSQGRFLGPLGYLYTLLEGGGFVKDYSHIHQGVFNAKLNYFTPLFIINRFKVRHFISTRYVRGIRRFEDEFVRIKKSDGIRGFRSDLPAGQQKTVLNYELDAFTPWYLYGFRFVVFGFTDLAIVGAENRKWHNGDFYSGIGAGIRIRNERLVFETITLRFGFYPRHPETSFPLFMDTYGEQRLNPENFYVTKPETIPYR